MAPSKVHHHWTFVSWVPYVLTLLVVLLCLAPVQSKWCTRLVTYTTVRSYIDQTMCNQSYVTSCGFFSFEECTRYELVPCMKESNKTILQYKIMEGCCPGYELDPINNLTCINVYPDNTKGKEEVNPEQIIARKTVQLLPSVSENVDSEQISLNSAETNGPVTHTGDDGERGEGTDSTPSAAVVEASNSVDNEKVMSPKSTLAEEESDAAMHFYDKDSSNKLFGLSNGAYAGIISSLVFLLCVVVLVSVRLHKRSRNEKLKKSQPQNVEMEVTEKMMTDSQA